MLGRLEMDVDECIGKYSDLIESIFKKKSWLPVNRKLKIKARFDSQKLADAITKVVNEKLESKTETLKGGAEAQCKV